MHRLLLLLALALAGCTSCGEPAPLPAPTPERPATITLRCPGTGEEAVLSDAHEVAEVARELAWAQSVAPGDFREARFHPAPDLRITLRFAEREQVYEVVGRAVLHDPQTHETWQFSTGIALAERLHAR